MQASMVIRRAGASVGARLRVKVEISRSATSNLIKVGSSLPRDLGQQR